MLTIKSLFLVGARDQFFLISSIYSNACLARGATIRINGFRTSGKDRQKVPMNSVRERERERERDTIIITLTQVYSKVVVQYRILTINFVRFLVNRGGTIQNIDNNICLLFG